MPRAVDRYQPTADHDPNISGTEFHISLMMQEQAEMFRMLWEQIAESIRETIIDFVKKTTGIDLETWEQFLQGLSEQLGLDNFAEWVQTIVRALQGINLLEPASILRAIAFILGTPTPFPSLQQLAHQAGQLLHGIIAPGRLSQVSIGALSEEQPNLLLAGTFPNAGSIQDITPVWGYSAVTRSADGTGSLRGFANGEFNAIVSNPIPCAKDQIIEIEAYAMWSGLVASGTPIRVQVKKYLNGAFVGTDPIAEVSAPASSSSAHTGNVDGWVEMTDTWTVPAGVDEYRVRFIITEDASAGTVHFDDVVSRQIGQIKQSWVQNLAQDFADALAFIQGVIDRIFNGWANLGELIDFDNPLGSVIDAIAGLLGISLGAQSNVSAVEARVRALESAGNTIMDDFARGSDTSLGSNYTVRSFGGGAGSIGTDGRGNAVWRPSGFGNRTQMARRNDATLGVDGFLYRAVFASNPQSYLFDDAYTYLLARVNATGTSYLRLRLGYGTALLQAVVSDSVTNIGSSVSIPTNMAGRVLEWQGGRSGNTELRSFRVTLDGNQIINATDSGAVSALGSNNRGVGLGMETGNRLVFFQNIPAALAFYSVSEVL